jgi:hypothetical protein
MLLLAHGGDTLDLSDYETNGIYVGKVDIGSPAVREVSNDVVDADGVADETQFIGARVLSLSGTLVASATAGTRQEILARLQRFCDPGIRPTITIALNDDEPRVATLRPEGCAAPIERPGTCTFAAAWRIPDPRFYVGDGTGAAVWEQVTVYPPASVSQGRAYNLAFPRIYPSAWGGSGFVGVTVEGAAPTWPTHTIYGPATNPIVTITDDTGHTSVVAFNALTLAIGDYLTIETELRAVYLNGDRNADRYSTIDVTRTIWGPMYPGANTVRFNADAFAAPAVLVTAWRSAYL